jgi:hypothetical protein
MDVARPAKPAGFRVQGQLGNVSTKVSANPAGVVVKVKCAPQLPRRRKGD